MPEESQPKFVRMHIEQESCQPVLIRAARSQTRLASLAAFAKISLLLVGE
jgi:hypothetical protein